MCIVTCKTILWNESYGERIEKVIKKNIYIIYLLTAIGLPPGGSSTVHIYTKTMHRITQKCLEECGPCPVFASYTLTFALQLRKKHGKISVMVAEECHLAR
jgi:hypothetical protein